MDSSSSCTFRKRLPYDSEDTSADLPANTFASLATKHIPITGIDKPKPLKTNTIFKAPLPVIATSRLTLDNQLPDLRPETTLDDLKANEYTASFVTPDACYEEIAQNIRSPLKSSCDILFPYASRTSKNLIESCLKRISQWKKEMISSIVKELISPLEAQELSLNPISSPRAHKKKLEELCKQKTNLLTTPALTRALIRHLPLTVIAQAKVEASFFCLLLRFIKQLSPYEKIPDISTIDRIRAQIQHQELSLIEDLNLSHSYIEILPLSICEQITNIKALNFSSNNCDSLPLLHSLQTLSSLEELDLSRNKFTSIPLSFFDHLPYLRKIDLRSNPISDLEIERIKKYFETRNLEQKTEVFI